MIRAFYLEGETVIKKDGADEAARAWRSQRPLWIDIKKEDTSFLSETCKFHPLAIEICALETPVPKVEDFGDYLFAELHIPVCKGDSVRAYELDIFVGKDFLVTYAREDAPVLGLNEKIAARRASSPLRLLRYLFDRFVFREIWELLEDVDDRMDALEAQLARWHLTQPVFRRITATGSVVGKLRNTLMAQQRTLEELAEEARDMVEEGDMPYLLDMVDRHYRLVSESEYLQQRSATIYQIFVDSKDYESNEVMKVLTLVATLVLPAMLIAGIYGMNFRHMPELYWWWAYPASLALMVAIGLFIFIYMKRKKWF